MPARHAAANCSPLVAHSVRSDPSTDGRDRSHDVHNLLGPSTPPSAVPEAPPGRESRIYRRIWFGTRSSPPAGAARRRRSRVQQTCTHEFAEALRSVIGHAEVSALGAKGLSSRALMTRPRSRLQAGQSRRRRERFRRNSDARWTVGVRSSQPRSSSVRRLRAATPTSPRAGRARKRIADSRRGEGIEPSKRGAAPP